MNKKPLVLNGDTFQQLSSSDSLSGNGSGLTNIDPTAIEITTSTPTNINGIIKGNGLLVEVATPGTDYLLPFINIFGGNAGSY
ncbi:MAG: hypothetical protein ABSG25_01470 [Bryobacteraceae bacterium]